MNDFFLMYVLVLSSLFANDNFTVSSNNNVNATITFNMGEISFVEEGGYHKINSDAKVMIDNLGEPEIPTYGFNYAVDRNKEYNVSYIINEFEIYENINIHPYQGIVEKDFLSKRKKNME